jgi:hypothetical protein
MLFVLQSCYTNLKVHIFFIYNRVHTVLILWSWGTLDSHQPNQEFRHQLLTRRKRVFVIYFYFYSNFVYFSVSVSVLVVKCCSVARARRRGPGLWTCWTIRGVRPRWQGQCCHVTGAMLSCDRGSAVIACYRPPPSIAPRRSTSALTY